MNQEKIQELVSDEEFVKSLLEMESAEEVQAALAERDVDVTVDEIKKLAELLQKKASGELTEDELEEISGGFVLEAAFFAVVTAVGVGVGLVKAVRSRW